MTTETLGNTILFMNKQTFTMTFAGSTYRLGKLDAEQIMTIRALIQFATFQPADSPITEDSRWIKIEGSADREDDVHIDRRVIFNRAK